MDILQYLCANAEELARAQTGPGVGVRRFANGHDTHILTATLNMESFVRPKLRVRRRD